MRPDTSAVTSKSSLAFRLYDVATGDDDARLCRDIPEDQCSVQPGNLLRQVAAQALAKTGDALADSKVVLPWLLGAVGAPLFLVGLLVPIRESLALLPQILVGGVIRRFAVRKFFWVGASIAEGLCVLLMALTALAGIRGALAGWTIVALLVVFSLARGIASVATKDTLGKTVSKGRRGRVSGQAASVSGLVAGLVGLYLALAPASLRPDWLLYAMILAAGICWLLAASVFAAISEQPGASEGGRGVGELMAEKLRLLLRDGELRRFLLVRTLLLSTALVGPLLVSLAQRATGLDLGGLGWLVVASGMAGALSAGFWGMLSDRSSRRTMALAAAIAGCSGIGLLAAVALVPRLGEDILPYAAALFGLGIAHAGVRIGRKTHVVDLAGGDRKAEYVALSNSLIGVLLLLAGLLVGILTAFSLEIAVAALSLLALLGAATALTMKEVQS